MGYGNEVGGVGETEMVAMDKIRMSARREPDEQRMARSRVELVPPHMRDFERPIARLDRYHLSANPAKSLDGLEFSAPVGHQLHSDADPEKRSSASDHRLVQRRLEAGDCREPAPAIGKGADAGQDNPIGAGNGPRVTVDLDLSGNSGLARCALKGLRGRA